MPNITENLIFKNINSDELKSIIKKLNKPEQSKLTTEITEQNVKDSQMTDNKIFYLDNVKGLNIYFSVVLIKSLPVELRNKFKEIVSKLYKENV